MSANTKIEWATHISLNRRKQLQAVLVDELMARHAERNAVRRIEPEILELGKRSYVVGVQIAAAIVTTVATSEAISHEHIVSPTFQFDRRSKAPAFKATPIDISRSCISTDCPSSNNRADLGPCFDGVSLTNAPPIPEALGTHDRFGVDSVCSAFEGGNTSLSALSDFYSSAGHAPRRESIESRCVACKAEPQLPRLALRATFFTSGHTREVVGQRKTGLLRRNLGGAFWSLCHG